MKQFFDNIFLQKAQSNVWLKTMQVDDALKKKQKMKISIFHSHDF